MTSDAFLRGSRLEKRNGNSKNNLVRIGGKYEQLLYLSLFIQQMSTGIVNLPLSLKLVIRFNIDDEYGWRSYAENIMVTINYVNRINRSIHHIKALVFVLHRVARSNSRFSKYSQEYTSQLRHTMERRQQNIAVWGIYDVAISGYREN